MTLYTSSAAMYVIIIYGCDQITTFVLVNAKSMLTEYYNFVDFLGSIGEKV